MYTFAFIGIRANPAEDIGIVTHWHSSEDEPKINCFSESVTDHLLRVICYALYIPFQLYMNSTSTFIAIVAKIQNFVTYLKI